MGSLQKYVFLGCVSGLKFNIYRCNSTQRKSSSVNHKSRLTLQLSTFEHGGKSPNRRIPTRFGTIPVTYLRNHKRWQAINKTEPHPRRFYCPGQTERYSKGTLTGTLPRMCTIEALVKLRTRFSVVCRKKNPFEECFITTQNVE